MVIRDPDKLEGTVHLKQQMRERNIGAFEVKKAIREGSVEPGSGGDADVRYRLEFPGPDLIVDVDTDRMNITTAFYDDQQGAEGGRL